MSDHWRFTDPEAILHGLGVWRCRPTDRDAKSLDQLLRQRRARQLTADEWSASLMGAGVLVWRDGHPARAMLADGRALEPDAGLGQLLQGQPLVFDSADGHQLVLRKEDVDLVAAHAFRRPLPSRRPVPTPPMLERLGKALPAWLIQAVRLRLRSGSERESEHAVALGLLLRFGTAVTGPRALPPPEPRRPSEVLEEHRERWNAELAAVLQHPSSPTRAEAVRWSKTGRLLGRPPSRTQGPGSSGDESTGWRDITGAERADAKRRLKRRQKRLRARGLQHLEEPPSPWYQGVHQGDDDLPRRATARLEREIRVWLALVGPERCDRLVETSVNQASELRKTMDVLLRSPRGGPAWAAKLNAAAARRDDLASVYRVLSIGGVARPLGAALHALDAELDEVRFEDEGEPLPRSRRLEAVALLDPDAWWSLEP